MFFCFFVFESLTGFDRKAQPPWNMRFSSIKTKVKTVSVWVLSQSRLLAAVLKAALNRSRHVRVFLTFLLCAAFSFLRRLSSFQNIFWTSENAFNNNLGHGTDYITFGNQRNTLCTHKHPERVFTIRLEHFILDSCHLCSFIKQIT